MLQGLSSCIYLCTHMDVHNEFLETGFLDQSVYAMIILIGTGTQQRLSIYMLANVLWVSTHLHAINFFCQYGSLKKCKFPRMSFSSLFLCSPRMNPPCLLVPTYSEQYSPDYHDYQPCLKRHSSLLVSHHFLVVLFSQCSPVIHSLSTKFPISYE